MLPTTWGAGNYYTDDVGPIVAVPPGRSFTFSFEAVNAHGDRLDATIVPPPGTKPFLTNIMGGPLLVSITGGIERLGRTEEGYTVVRHVLPGHGAGPRPHSDAADDPAIRFGRWFSTRSV